MSDNIVTVNLKYDRETRAKFKNTIKKQGHKSMQLVLSAFTNAYIENPDQFCIKLGVKENGKSLRETSENKS